jgi:hypothetical protein
MRGWRIVTCVTLLAVAAGCQSQMVVGTWTADKSGADSPIARATFCGDGTFTAEAEYGGGKTHAMSGRYNVEGSKLKLTADGGSTREYGLEVCCHAMTMTHQGKSAKLNRMKG